MRCLDLELLAKPCAISACRFDQIATWQNYRSPGFSTFSTALVVSGPSEAYQLNGRYRVNTVEQLGVEAIDFIVNFLIRRLCSG